MKIYLPKIGSYPCPSAYGATAPCVTRQPSIDPTTLCFNDRELESAWWHKQASSALEDDSNDTIIFTRLEHVSHSSGCGTY
jgi:hypothetical protein